MEDFKEDLLSSPEVRRLQADAWALDALVRAEFAMPEADLVMALRAVDGLHFFMDPRWLDERSYPENLAAASV